MANQSEKLEREAGRTRAQLSETLDELRARMNPGQVIDQLIDYAQQMCERFIREEQEMANVFFEQLPAITRQYLREYAAP
jgi:Protein of unknown function (DUF3618)